jgi:ABC-type dipeptide/oligopeptide/nickel transport system ATPase subunit
MIEAEDLAVDFSGVRALDGVSFAVGQGESFGIVGESGSGKSTVLRLLAGLLPRWSGRLCIDGMAVPPLRRPRFSVQMVFQDPYGSLHPRHSVDRVLAEPLAIGGVDGREAKIAAALAEVGLGPDHRFRYPHQLSGGQRQRVAIARALIQAPRLLLLDEPTAALDVSVQAEILALLERVRRERGLTTVLVSHNLAIVARLCSRIAVMRQGRLVEEIGAEELRAGRAREGYTLALIEASRGYRRNAG